MSKIDEIEKRIEAGDNFTIEPDGTVRDMTAAEVAAYLQGAHSVGGDDG